MRIFMACLIIFFSLRSYASPIWTYELTGEITGSNVAAGYLKDISVGDSFRIQMFVQNQDERYDQKVEMVGQIGAWLFSYSNASGFYYGGDSSPERWISLTGNDFAPPIGNSGIISSAQLGVTLFGFDETGTAGWPEEDWLVKLSGEIDPERFLRGGINLDFSASIDTGETVVWDDVSLSGEIMSFVRVPEPNTLAILALGLLGFVVVPRPRMIGFRATSP